MHTAVITIDDMSHAAYKAAHTPYLDKLLEEGGIRRFVGSHACSPFRAQLETGRYALSPLSHVAGNLGPNTQDSLPVGSHLLARRVLGAHQVGKWHLAAKDDLDHRWRCGYEEYQGPQSNLGQQGTGDYWSWDSVNNGVLERVAEYATAWTADRVAEATLAGAPLISAHFNAIHKPVHYPPGYSGDGSFMDMKRAMLEDLDARLMWLVPYLLGAGYAVIVVSDNGGSVEEGGKYTFDHRAVATYCATAGFDRREPNGAVTAVDLHATVLDLVTGSAPGTDGHSLLSWPTHRRVVFGDKWGPVFSPPQPDRLEMATDGDVKVVRNHATGVDLVTDWFDRPTTLSADHLIDALNNR